MKRLVLVDGNALLHRAYHATPLSASKRESAAINHPVKVNQSDNNPSSGELSVLSWSAHI